MVMGKPQEFRYRLSEKEQRKEADEAEKAFWKVKEGIREHRARVGWNIFRKMEDIRKQRERLGKAALLKAEIDQILRRDWRGREERI
jgi:hypothetical protein